MAQTYTVRGMSCDGCEEIVVGAVEEVGGVESATADHESDELTVDGDADLDAVAEAVDFAGYEPDFGSRTDADDEDGDEDGEEADDEGDEAADDEADDTTEE